jgi:hypothetical protein
MSAERRSCDVSECIYSACNWCAHIVEEDLIFVTGKGDEQSVAVLSSTRGTPQLRALSGLFSLRHGKDTPTAECQLT